MTSRKRSFNPSSTLEERALQAWLILIGTAVRRQTIRYGELAQLMFGVCALRSIGKILGHIAYYCDAHGYPPLNCIVVNTRGRAGHGIPKDSDFLREKVFDFRWYDLMPPTSAELKALFDVS